MTRLLLIRHGESETNHSGCFTGQLDAGLSELGKRQAACCAPYLAEYYDIAAVYAADLKRASETARPTAEYLSLPLRTDPRLREIRVPQWQGVPFTDIEARDPEAKKLWDTDIGNFALAGAESVRDVLHRFTSALRDIAAACPGRDVAVFTHALPIRSLQTFLETGSLDAMNRTPWVFNASLTEVLCDGEELRFGRIGLTDHLEGMKTVLTGI